MYFMKSSKLLVLLMCASVFGYRPSCDKKSVSKHVQIPTYDFSVRILDRISQETDGHFVFSPFSTWLQLLSLADGAKGYTLKEILKTARYYRILCLRNLVKDLFNSLDEDVRVTMKHQSVIVIDDLLNVKRSFVKQAEGLQAVRVLREHFRARSKSADKVNDIIKKATNGTIADSIDPYDFIRSVLIMIDAICLKANWRSPFNPVYTGRETFYSYEKVSIGTVNMMNQIGYFKVAYIPNIDAQSLELPFNDRLTMLLFLPNNGTAADLFWSMKKVRLSTIFRLLNSNAPRLVNVKLPRFKVTTDIDNIPELLNDMGVQRMFIPRLADFRRISNHNVYVSMMLNKAEIEVTETGVSGNVGPDSLIAHKESINISFNQPFAYLIVDKITNVILFAGIYSDPSVYFNKKIEK